MNLEPGSIVPRKNRAGDNQPEFGQGDVTKFVADMIKGRLQPPPTLDSAGGFNISVPVVSPIDTGQYHRNGSIIWVHRQASTATQKVFDSSTLMFLTMQQAIYETHRASIIKKKSGNSTETITKLDTENDSILAQYMGNAYRLGKNEMVNAKTFVNMSDFVKNITLAGVKAEDPEGYSSKLVGSHQVPAKESVISLAFYSRQPIHEKYFDAPYNLEIGTKLYALIKKVPMSWCINRSQNGDGLNKISEADRENDKNMVIVILYYASPDGFPPPRSLDVKLFENVHDQPPLYCRDYKEFPDPNKPKKFILRDGHCIFIGYNLFRVPAKTNVPYLNRREVPMLPQKELIKGGLIDAFVYVKPKFR